MVELLLGQRLDGCDQPPELIAQRRPHLLDAWPARNGGRLALPTEFLEPPRRIYRRPARRRRYAQVLDHDQRVPALPEDRVVQPRRRESPLLVIHSFQNP